MEDDQKNSSIILIDSKNLQFFKKCQGFYSISNILLSNDDNIVFVKEISGNTIKTFNYMNGEVLETQQTQDWDDTGCVAEVKNFYLIGGFEHITIIEKQFHKVVGYLNVHGTVQTMCESGDGRYIFAHTDANNLYMFDVYHNPIMEMSEFENSNTILGTKNGNLLIGHVNGKLQ